MSKRTERIAAAKARPAEETEALRLEERAPKIRAAKVTLPNGERREGFIRRGIANGWRARRPF